jgi:hypothetical protein
MILAPLMATLILAQRTRACVSFDDCPVVEMAANARDLPNIAVPHGLVSSRELVITDHAATGATQSQSL